MFRPQYASDKRNDVIRSDALCYHKTVIEKYWSCVKCACFMYLRDVMENTINMLFDVNDSYS